MQTSGCLYSCSEADALLTTVSRFLEAPPGSNELVLPKLQHEDETATRGAECILVLAACSVCKPGVEPDDRYLGNAVATQPPLEKNNR